MGQPLENVLQHCTVKITVPDKRGHGTGFIVAPGLLLSCAHVVRGDNNQCHKEPVKIWQKQNFISEAEVTKWLPDLDIALLKFSPPPDSEFPCVYLDEAVASGDELYIFGYPDQDYPNGCPVTFNSEGLTGDEPPLIKFKLGQVRPGMSGAPLLNQRTGKVCGVVKFTRSRGDDLGGGAVTKSVIISQFSALAELQQRFHREDKRWIDNITVTTPYDIPQLTTDRNSLPPVVCNWRPEQYLVPYRSLGSGFVGKVNDLWALHDILRDKGAAVVEGVGVVSGMGGLGKTQLAIEYVNRFTMCYPGGIFWVDAERGLSAVIAQLLPGLSHTEIDNTLGEGEQLICLWNKLSHSQHVLIVFDNFPENESLRKWLPPSGTIQVLVTTRRRDHDYSRIALQVMSIEEGMELLNKGERVFGQEGEKIVEALGGLPLAIELTRKFLELRRALTIEGLLEQMAKEGEINTLGVFAKKYHDELPSGHEKEVAATIKISWDIASKNNTAKSVLQAMSLVDPTPVPSRLLRKILDLPSASILEDPLDDAISELTNRFSLIELDNENDPQMHRLVSAFVRTTIDENDKLFEDLVASVEREMARTTDEEDVHAYYELQKVLPHAETLVASESIDPEQAIKIAEYLSRHYSRLGTYRLSEKYGRKSLLLCEQCYPRGSAEIARSQSNLATVLQDLGELEEARDLLRQALESDQKSFEPGHSSIAISQSNLALVLKDLGELEEARDLAYQAYDAFLNRLGPGHSYTKTAKANWESI